MVATLRLMLDKEALDVQLEVLGQLMNLGAEQSPFGVALIW